MIDATKSEREKRYSSTVHNSQKSCKTSVTYIEIVVILDFSNSLTIFLSIFTNNKPQPNRLNYIIKLVEFKNLELNGIFIANSFRSIDKREKNRSKHFNINGCLGLHSPSTGNKNTVSDISSNSSTIIQYFKL